MGDALPDVNQRPPSRLAARTSCAAPRQTGPFLANRRRLAHRIAAESRNRPRTQRATHR